MGKGCMFDDCVCYLTSHDYPSLVEGKNHGILLLYKKWKKYYKIQSKKNKLDWNNRIKKNHPPSSLYQKLTNFTICNGAFASVQ